MLLAIDCGNTNIVFAVFDGDALKGEWRASTDVERTADELGVWLTQLLSIEGLSRRDIDAAIIASVVPAMVFNLKTLCRRYFKCEPLVVGDDGVDLGLEIRLDRPEEVGADRLVNAVAAHQRYSGPLIVIDFGTATTFDAVTPKGEYLGGAICPGVTISMEALFRAASKLPRVEFQRPPHVVGRNTVHSIQSGLVYGYVGLVDGLCVRMAQELGTAPKVVATGGLASLVAGISTAITEVDDQLTLDGLRIIHERNR